MIHDDAPDSAEDARDAAGAECARRSLLRGAAVLGAVGIGGALSRIGAGSSDAVSLTAAQGATASTKTGAAGAQASAAAKPVAGTPGATKPAAPAGGAAKGRAIGSASGVPVGGGAVFKKVGIVVTQPTAGVFKAFDSTCTHEKCFLTDIADGTINCACHGAKFSITDGSVVSFFPITDPLPAKGTVTVAGGKLLWAT